MATARFAGFLGLRTSVGELLDLVSRRVPAHSFRAKWPPTTRARAATSNEPDMITAPAPSSSSAAPTKGRSGKDPRSCESLPCR